MAVPNPNMLEFRIGEVFGELKASTHLTRPKYVMRSKQFFLLIHCEGYLLNEI